MTIKNQVSFTGGEVSPALHGRVDLDRYNSTLALCKNWFVHTQGGISTRAGFRYINSASKDHTKAVRLIPFQFNTEQTYILALGDQTMRVIKDGGLVLENDIAITGATQANPVVVTAAAHGLINGDYVFIKDIVGMTEINNRFFTIVNVTANTFELSGIDGTAFTAYISGGNVARVYETSTPWPSTDLFLLKYTQSADVMTVTHPSHGPYDITRNATAGNHFPWPVTPVAIGSTIAAPTNMAISQNGTASGANNKTYEYVVTVIDSNSSESVASPSVNSGSINALSQTWGNKIEWNKISGATQANPVVITMAAHQFVNGNRVKFNSVGGMTQLNGNTYQITKLTANTFSLQDLNGVDIDGTGFTAYTSGGYCNFASAEFFNVYKLNSDATGVYGYIGQSESNEFTDYNLGPDMSVTPPSNNDPFADGNNPFCLTYHQQRLFYGGAVNAPQSLFGSRSGTFTNFDLSNPVRSDDSIEYTLATQQVNEIRHLVSLDTLFALTSGGCWRIDGDADGIVTPKTINTRNQNRRGCSNVPPIIAGGNVVYIQDRGGRVLDFGYQFQSDKYLAEDLSIMAEHLFYGYTIVDWCYAEEPYSLIWAVRDDGMLLTLAYLREHQVWAWSQHETAGQVESVASIAEGDENVVYAVIKRNINGSDVRFIERLNERRFTDIVDAFCVDSGLTYTGAATTTITNLDHLEGESVCCLADGNVVEGLTVTDGQITLPDASSTVHVGLQYICDIQTLDISIQGNNIPKRKKRVTSIGIKTRDTRGLKAGVTFDTNDLYEVKERTVSMNYGSIPIFTGLQEFEVAGGWSDGGRVCVRQDYPLPATILAITPEFDVE